MVESSPNEEIKQTYDAVTYDALAHTNLHPIRIATPAVLRGVTTAPIGTSRVLEFGCAQASNLIAFAEMYPEASFVGIDISTAQVALARQAISELGLKNIEVNPRDLTLLDERLGQFDYIIAHGLYSWVPAPVRDRLLTLVGALLAPGGVALVSYNTFPGWHIKLELRSLLLDHVREIGDIDRRVQSAADFLPTLAAQVNRQSAWGQLMGGAIDDAISSPRWFLAHELLENENHPVYLRDFVEHAAQHHLRYLDDFVVTDEPEFVGWLGDMPRTAEDVRVQQERDLLQGRTFRSAALCRADEPVVDRADHACLLDMFVAANVSLSSDEPPVSKFALHASGDRILETADRLLAAALLELGDIWPDSITVRELAAMVALKHPEFTGIAPPDVQLADRLVQLYTDHPTGMIPLELSVERYPLTTTISDRPLVAGSNRRLADRGPIVTTRRHERAHLDDALQFVVKRLDGQHTVDDLENEFLQAVSDGDLQLSAGEERKPVPPAEQRSAARAVVVGALEKAASYGLLIG